MTRGRLCAAVIVTATLLAASVAYSQSLESPTDFDPRFFDDIGQSINDEPYRTTRPPTPKRQSSAEVVFRLEYLNWQIKDAPVPTPLVTTGDAAGLGRIGSPATKVLLGEASQSFGPFSGGRVSFSGLDRTDSWGLDFSLFFFEQRAVHFLQASGGGAGDAILALPFVDVSGPPVESSLVIAQSGVRSGEVAYANLSQMYGLEFNALRAVGDSTGDPLSFCWLGGVRALSLTETLQLSTNSTNFSGGTAHHSDIFSAQNMFIGLQIGARGVWQRDPLRIEVSAKFSFGGNSDVLRIAGQDSLSPVTRVSPILSSHEGFFAQPSNIGRYRPGYFAYVPEVQARVSYRITEHMSLTAGYDLLYWTAVLRPGNQIDSLINTTQTTGPLSGPAYPGRSYHPADFWAGGWSAGLQWVF
jgi:hypothetical protein